MNEVEQESEELSASPTRWKGTKAIQLVHQVNERCIDMVCDVAVDGSVEVEWPFLSSNRDLWRRLDANARRRLARFPFVIVDVRFGDGAWWRSMGECSPRARWPVNAVSNGLPANDCECLSLEALMFAWQVARQDLRVAHMVFAMAPTVATSIAALSMRDIRTIGIRGAAELRVRWDDKPMFWRELLLSARDDDEEALMALKHQAGRRVLDVLRRVGQL